MGLREEAGELQEELTRLRHSLHREPEIGLDLPLTQKKVLDAIDGLPLEVFTGRSLSSVTAVLRGSPGGPTVLLRGDMDALPLVEQTGVGYVSEIAGAMHACGHDLHTTMLVGAAKLLSRRVHQIKGNVIFMFQPGEEGWDGAAKMIGEGLLEVAGDRPVAAYGLHVAAGNVPLGKFATRVGALSSASARMAVLVRGVGGHGSKPHLSKDPVPGACEMILALQAAVTRSFDVFDPVVLTVGSLHGGTARNIIASEVKFEATIRCYSEASSERIEEIFTRICRGIGAAHGLEVDVDFAQEYPPMVGSQAGAVAAQKTVTALYGEDEYLELEHAVYGSEDFAYVLKRVGGTFIFMGSCAPVDAPGIVAQNHSDNVIFEDSVLSRGSAVLAGLALGHLNPGDGLA
ncbi:M20 metallopeptidase family protein [Arthrobacter cryoconiti]|uniref:M20 family metallopeptidase n=1 Tax=Arthrobacter cryoconiti TaxID=748907 RepID=A0ABV8R1R3_9MICC|nr:M20 family metallopeptidase [Arthrobacter cryoconiti]MCC9069816.1 M20 family metallopeptidase [Arthrobacter cryoconiti]